MRRALIALTLIAATFAQDKDKKGLRLPRWFTLYEPEGELIDEQTPDKVHVSYDADAKYDSVVGYYETTLREAKITGVSYAEGGDGHTASFEVISDDILCKLKIGRQAKPHVEMGCSDTHYAEVLAAIAGVKQQSAEPNPSGLLSPAPATALRPGIHQVEYIIDGSASKAGLTYRNSGGGTEQQDVTLPARLTFQTASGAFLYIAAQKKGEEGTVHVVIAVDGKAVRQSISSAAYGIASASSKIGK